MKNISLFFKILCFFLFCIFLTFSCKGYSSSFIDEIEYRSKKESFINQNIQSYSFKCTVGGAGSPYEYVFSLIVKNGILIEKKYEYFGCENVFDLSDVVLNDMIQNTKNKLGVHYENSLDKIVIELKNMDGIFDLIEFIYRSAKTKVEENQSEYYLTSDISYDETYYYPELFFAKAIRKNSASFAGGSGYFHIEVSNFICGNLL